MFNYSIDISKICKTNLKRGFEYATDVGINNIEIGEKLSGSNLWELSGAELEAIRDAFIDSGKKIVLITLESALDFESKKKFFRAAHLLMAENIKVKISDDMEAISSNKETFKIASSFGIRPLIENNAQSILKTDIDMLNFWSKNEGYELGFIYNPFEFVKLSHHPFFHMFYTSHLKNDIVFLRLNDGLYSGDMTPLANGNCEIKELISILIARTYKGYFSIGDYRAAGLKATIDEFKKIAKSL